MASFSGALGGLTSGAALGSNFGPIGTGIGAIAGGLLGGIFGGKPSAQDTAEKSILGNIPNLINKGNTATDQGLSQLNGAGNFYKGILSGDRNAVSSLLGPTTSTILSQYDNAANAVKNFGSRGGGATSTLAQLPFQKAGAAGSAYESVLPSAASGLTQVGSATGQLGESLTNSAMEQSPALLDYQQLEQKMIQSAGKGLGQIGASGGPGGTPGVGGLGSVPGGATPNIGAGIKALGNGIGALWGKIFGGGNILKDPSQQGIPGAPTPQLIDRTGDSGLGGSIFTGGDL